MKKNVGRIFAGLALIAVAVLVILGTLGIGFEFPGGIEVWQWVVGIIVFVVLIESLRHLDLVPAFLMLGFEVMIFEPQLGLIFGFEEKNWISNWLVLFVSVLIGIGFSMMFRGVKVKLKVKKNTLGGVVKYVDCTNMKSETFYNKLGDMEIRFENQCNFEKDACLSVHNTLGDMRVYIPAEWNVKIITVNTLGEVNVDEIFDQQSDGDGIPTLTVKAYNKLGEINIRAQ